MAIVHWFEHMRSLFNYYAYVLTKQSLYAQFETIEELIPQPALRYHVEANSAMNLHSHWVRTIRECWYWSNKECSNSSCLQFCMGWSIEHRECQVYQLFTGWQTWAAQSELTCTSSAVWRFKCVPSRCSRLTEWKPFLSKKKWKWLNKKGMKVSSMDCPMKQFDIPG